MDLWKSRCAVAMLAILLLVCNVAAFAANPSGGKTAASDKAQVVDTMRTMYAAATKDDLEMFHSVGAPDFYAFDNGKRYDGDALMQLVKNLHAKGDVFVWRVTDPEVHVTCNSAWITYINRGSVQDASGIKNLTWLESAVLQKKAGRWRIRFFHSTLAP